MTTRMKMAASFPYRTEAMNKTPPDGFRSESNLRSEADRAITAACNILAYADNTERRLRRKLRDRGYSPEAIDAAVDYVTEKGFLDESRMLESTVHSLVRYRHYGLSRILRELAVRGFDRDIADEFDFSQIDFLTVCRELFYKHGGIPDDKTRAFLLRHGHRASDIRTVFSEAGENSGDED